MRRTLRDVVAHSTDFFIDVLHPWCCKWQWFRRWYGGRWELWSVDFPVCGTLWHDIPPGQEGIRPSHLCRGTAQVIEEYPVRKMRKD